MILNHTFKAKHILDWVFIASSPRPIPSMSCIVHVSYVDPLPLHLFSRSVIGNTRSNDQFTGLSLVDPWGARFLFKVKVSGGCGPIRATCRFHGPVRSRLYWCYSLRFRSWEVKVLLVKVEVQGGQGCIGATR